MLNRILWVLVRRFILKLRIKGFSASSKSYADLYSQFSEYNRLYGNTNISNSRLGRYTYVSRGARIGNSTIGAFCSIGPESIVGGLGRHPTEWLSTHPLFYSILMQINITFSDSNYFDELPYVRVGNDVWIGARAIILDGLIIGDGAIVAAGSVVTSNVEPYSIVGGVPARFIKKRFDEKTIIELQQINWWEWHHDKLQKYASKFRTTNPSLLSEEIE